MRQQKPLRSEMGWSTPDKITVRGLDLCNELLGKIDLGGMAWLELTGRMPTPQEAAVFNALLVTLVEHGMTPHAIASRMVQVCAPEAMQAAVAAGICAVGSVFAGGSEMVGAHAASRAQGCAGRRRHRRAGGEDRRGSRQPQGADLRHRPSAAQADRSAHAGAVFHR